MDQCKLITLLNSKIPVKHTLTLSHTQVQMHTRTQSCKYSHARSHTQAYRVQRGSKVDDIVEVDKNRFCLTLGAGRIDAGTLNKRSLLSRSSTPEPSSLPEITSYSVAVWGEGGGVREAGSNMCLWK